MERQVVVVGLLEKVVLGSRLLNVGREDGQGR